MTPILANAILGKSVKREDGLLVNGQQITYEDLKSHGILMLEPVGITQYEFYIHIPYLWVWLLIKAAADRTLKLKELLNGVLCSNSFIDKDVKISGHNSVKIQYLRNQYPSRRPAADVWVHFIKEPVRNSKGHFSAKCLYCPKKFQHGEATRLMAHLANHCIGRDPEIRKNILN
ncbi:12203_t:CDS:2 [Entrophospora sp. SA101]|nr:12203_t:CDS:2 [Entrophospora sp. SA101]